MRLFHSRILSLCIWTLSFIVFGINDGDTFAAFRLIQSNAEPDHADVIFIGDDTGDEGQFRRAIPILQRLSRPGDILLTEGDRFQNAFLSARDSYPDFALLTHDLNSNGWDHPGMQDWSREFDLGTAAEMGVGELDSFILFSIAQQIDLVERNKIMVESILAARKQIHGKRVFVTASTFHVLEDKLLQYLAKGSWRFAVWAKHDADTIERQRAYAAALIGVQFLPEARLRKLLKPTSEQAIGGMYQSLGLNPLEPLVAPSDGFSNLYHPAQICRGALAKLAN